MPDQVCMLPAMERIPETFRCHALISMDVLNCVTGRTLKCITVRHRPGMKPFPQCLKATSKRNPKKYKVFVCRALSYRLLIIPTNPIVIQSRSILPLVVSAVLICLPSQVQCAISIRITVVGYVWTLARPQLLQIDDYTVCRLLAFLYHSLAVLTFGVSVWDKDCTGRWRHFPLMILSGWTSCSGVHGAITVAFFFFLMLCNCHCTDNKRDLRH